MPLPLTPERLAALLRPGATVYVPGASGESPVLVEALRQASGACAGVRFVGVWLPGMNRVDYAGLHPKAQAMAFFIGPELRDSFAAGRIALRPMTYFEAYRWLKDEAPVDVACLQVAPADADGRCSLGVANDFSPAVLGKAKAIVAHVNPSMPRTQGSACVGYDDIELVATAPAPLLAGDDVDDPVLDAIGRHIATLIRDGDTLEVGIGRVQSVLRALTHRRDLALHTGAITPSVLDLVAAGAIADRDAAITTGVAVGSDDLYRFVADNRRVRFRPVGDTHDIGVLRDIPGFVAINSVIEVDLLGQANAEMVDGRQISGAGGLTDFMRGARLSAGGRAIVALPATARRGRVSRIVPALGPGTTVSVARGDMDLVVTEYGVADVRRTDIDGRARALIGIAAPQFRDTLAEAWRQRRLAM